VMDWARRTVSWLGEARLLFWIFGTLLVVLLALRILGSSEPVVRYFGFGLQVLGICTILVNIQGTRTLFGKPSFGEAARAWLKSFPSVGQGARVTLEVASCAHVQIADKLVCRHQAGPDAGIEDRLRVLQSNFEILDLRTLQIQEQMSQASLGSAKALADERQERERQVDALTRQVDLAETGGLHVSVIGVVWLAIGLFLSTASQELSKLFLTFAE
jgi:hypothetical protein